MSDGRDSLRGGVEEGEELVVNITNGAYSVKQAAAAAAAEEEEAEPMKVEVAVGADGCYDSCDDLSYGEADLDQHLLGLEPDEEKCRCLRRQYRQLIHNVEQNREYIVNAANDKLSEALVKADVLFDEVIRTREAALDAQFLVLASDLGNETAKRLNADMCFFNPDAFCDFLCAFGGLRCADGHGRQELTGCSAETALSFWEAMQKEAACWTLQAEPFRFVFGSFEAEPSARRARRERRRPASGVDGSRDMPVKLRKLDLRSHPEATEKEVERILGLLQTYFRKYPDTPVSYFEFVVDPNSFSRTVENIFYVSFIIRDGFARIRLDQDRLPILEPISAQQAAEESEPGLYGRKQGVISLSLQDWRNIVAAFEISEPMISAP